MRVPIPCQDPGAPPVNQTGQSELGARIPALQDEIDADPGCSDGQGRLRARPIPEGLYNVSVQGPGGPCFYAH
ncbi:MAG: hypothetical protein MPI95_05685 [Nitrosopumilus sp.]|nr:hypothetical protein [Nitrosopumilus sp.]MDA7958561.1 hypothetical protein [Nitrosopumilus sp.]